MTPLRIPWSRLEVPGVESPGGAPGGGPSGGPGGPVDCPICPLPSPFTSSDVISSVQPAVGVYASIAHCSLMYHPSSQVRVNSPSPSTSLRSGCCCVSKRTCVCLKVFLGVFTSVCLDTITTTFNNLHITTRLLRLSVDRPATLLLAEEVHLPSLGHTLTPPQLGLMTSSLDELRSWGVEFWLTGSSLLPGFLASTSAFLWVWSSVLSTARPRSH